ncbi:MAG: ABC transporter permease [bacterium]|jgi:ABC-2 type transport system permease protein
MKKIGAITLTALRLYFRQPTALLMSLAVPVVVMTVFGIVFGGMAGTEDMDKPHAAIADEDKSDASKRVVDFLSKLGSIEISLTEKKKNDDGTAIETAWTRASAEDAIRAGRLATAIVIPAGFGKSVSGMMSAESLANEDARPTLEVLADTASPVTSEIVSGILYQAGFMALGPDVAGEGMGIIGNQLGIPDEYVKQIQNWMGENREFMTGGAGSGVGGAGGESLIRVEKVDVLGEKKANPVFSHQVAGVLTMWMLFTVAASGASLLRERESGTLRRILIAPVTPAAFIFGKYVAFFLVASLQTWVMFIAGWLIFKVEIFEHFWALLVFGALCGLAATGFGILLAALCKTQEQVGAVSSMIILTMSALGGSMLPREFMPGWMKEIGYFTFNGWAMDGFTKIFWRDMALSGIALECIVMAGIAIALTGIAAMLFSKRFAQ